MRYKLIALFAAAALFSGVARATESATTAQERAVRYQREVRAALAQRGWLITRDEASKLTAEHRYIRNTGTNAFLLGDDNSYARLQIDFQADGKSHTATTARASRCIHEPLRSCHVGFMAYPPLALRDPNLPREYLEVLAEAQTHLDAGSRGTHGVERSIQIASK